MSELGIYYVIRHKASGEYMPQMRKSRGYSHWNPTTGIIPIESLGIPRLLHSIKQASGCINAWNAMPNAHNTFDYEGEADLEIKSDGRKKEDLEIVEVELMVKNGNIL